MKLLTVNVGRPTPSAHTDPAVGVTGIDKRPVQGPVMISDPGPSGVGASGVAGDAVCNLRHHGGSDQAVYAFAREDLDRWEREIGRPLDNGAFGENFTTYGIDLTHAKIGERWRIGDDLVLEITSGRIPCRTFQGRVEEKGWIRRFTRRAETGAYLRVLVPGEARAGDPIEVIHRPTHDITVQLAFRAVTLERGLLPRVLAAGEALHAEELRLAREYVAKHGSGSGTEGGTRAADGSGSGSAVDADVNAGAGHGSGSGSGSGSVSGSGSGSGSGSDVDSGSRPVVPEVGAATAAFPAEPVEPAPN